MRINYTKKDNCFSNFNTNCCYQGISNEAHYNLYSDDNRFHIPNICFYQKTMISEKRSTFWLLIDL